MGTGGWGCVFQQRGKSTCCCYWFFRHTLLMFKSMSKKQDCIYFQFIQVIFIVETETDYIIRLSHHSSLYQCTVLVEREGWSDWLVQMLRCITSWTAHCFFFFSLSFTLATLRRCTCLPTRVRTTPTTWSNWKPWRREPRKPGSFGS